MVNVQGLLQKLKEKSRKEGISYQFMLQLVCQEEFLRRLVNSRGDLLVLTDIKITLNVESIKRQKNADWHLSLSFV
ncbi:MAG: hypothetical protein BI182_14015 [Acetobacterium sp. MES1]|nr:MAG: hypothetical protein BI182_14015 [Acetobacterium sp. MES1]